MGTIESWPFGFQLLQVVYSLHFGIRNEFMAQQGADQPVVQQSQVQAYCQPCLPEPFADGDISTVLRRFDL